MWHRGWMVGGLLACALVDVSCGGKAVVDPGSTGGTGGTGAGGTSTGGTTTTSTTSSTTTTSTTTVPPTPCELGCDALAECTAQLDCVALCEDSPAQCRTEHEDWVSCVADTVDPASCEHPQICHDELYTWLECLTDPGTMACSSGPNGECTCETSLNGTSYSTMCQGSGIGHCTCLIDGVTVGHCTETTTFPCDLFEGCCATVALVPY